MARLRERRESGSRSTKKALVKRAPTMIKMRIACLIDLNAGPSAEGRSRHEPGGSLRFGPILKASSVVPRGEIQAQKALPTTRVNSNKGTAYRSPEVTSRPEMLLERATRGSARR